VGVGTYGGFANSIRNSCYKFTLPDVKIKEDVHSRELLKKGSVIKIRIKPGNATGVE
jgi:hypothetical protein